MSRPSLAQSEVVLDRFEPASVGQTGFASVEPHVFGHLRPAFGVQLAYAHRPLELVQGDETLGLVVDHQTIFHLGMSLTLFERLELDLNAPATLSQGGDDPSAGGLNFGSPSGASFNDLRFGARVGLYSEPKSPFAASVGFRVWVPTGDEAAFGSTGSLRYEPYVSVGGRHSKLHWALNVGRKLQAEGSELQDATGSEITLRSGVWWVEPRWSVGPELSSATLAKEGTEAFSRAGTHAELLIGGKFKVVDDLTVGAAAGPGLTRGVGTPQYRGVLSVAWTPGLRASEEAFAQGPEAAPREPLTGQEPSDEFVPIEKPPEKSDRDLDGVMDSEDACPDVAGERAPKGAKPGCPPDRDEDGIIDMKDACPDIAGASSMDPKQHGCPADRDGDGIPDEQDACPGEAGPAHEDPKQNGCPPSVRIEGKQIVILEQVQFETGKHVILPESFPLLKQVAGVLNGHPDIVRLAVDGHTDSVGRLESNLALSRQRAVAVLRWLVENGVDERRLEARGFGPRRPIESNDSPEGRAKNRRVEFQILKRSQAGEQAWTDGEVTPDAAQASEAK